MSGLRFRLGRWPASGCCSLAEDDRAALAEIVPALATTRAVGASPPLLGPVGSRLHSALVAAPVPKKVAERAADEALKLLDEAPAPDGDGEELAAIKHQDPRRTWAARAVGGRAFPAVWQRCTWMMNLIADTGFWGVFGGRFKIP